MLIRVVFEPDAQTVTGRAGDSLLDLAAGAGIPVRAQCGGQGTCGGCRMVVRQGRIASHEGGEAEEITSPREVLACATRALGDLLVEVPADTRLDSVAPATEGYLSPAALALLEPARRGLPLAQRVTVQLPRPSPDDPSGDWERLVAGLTKALPEARPLHAELGLLRQLPGRLRELDFAVTADLVDEGSRLRLISLGGPPPGGPPLGPALGVALDIGTTTVRAHLVDLNTSAILGGSSQFNGQGRYGEDVISRIIWTQEHEKGPAQLYRAVTETINGLIKQLTAAAGTDPEQILAVSVAGNATMIALLLQLPAGTIRRAPHIPPISLPPVLAAGDLGLWAHPQAAVYCAPAINGYVGGDISAGVLATGLFAADELTLLVDVGTNGEWMICCACSAGPAFEGMGIACGIPARPGAVESLRYDPVRDETTGRTIGDEAPVGLCGNGLVETLATLLEARVIDRAGNLDGDYRSPRMRRVEEEWEFVLIAKDRTATGQDLVLRQSEIDNLLRAKAAVYAAISTLLEELGLEATQIQRLYLAGAFGSRLDLAAAMDIGLLPDMPPERVTVAGNTALMGAHLALLSSAAREQLAGLARAVTYFDLSSSLAFMEEYVAAQMLPHTDLDRFPRARQSVDRGSREALVSSGRSTNHDPRQWSR
jgi:uncharacterized 2Fe-2S/4Fe-4S cluster protein (DUF4445 family)